MRRTSADSAFRRTMASMTAGDQLSVVLEAIVRAVEEDAPGTLCSILLLADDGRHVSVAAAPSLPEDYNAAIDGIEIGPDVGSCGSAVFRNERVIVEDIQTSYLWRDYRELAAAADLRSCWSQPIRGHADEVLGVFGIYHRDVRAPVAEDIAFIEAAADLAAIAIMRQREQEELARSEARAKLAAEVERETARQLTTFFDVSLDMLCIRDMDLRFVKVNRAWEKALGYSVDELEGQFMLSFIHPDDVAASRGHMERVRANDEVVMGFVNRYRRRDGTYCYLEWRARRVNDMVFGVARDVTERLAIEAEMSAAREAAEAANLAKSEFLANMSHEIRTPLNGVIGVVQALARTELTPSQREMVSLIETSGVTLERLVSDILDVSKIEAGRMEIEARVFDLQDELSSLIELHRGRAEEKGLTLRAEFGPAARGEFHGDSTRLKQVLGNLLSNAVKFTEAGEIGLTVVARDEEPDLACRLSFEVHDTGIGFDAAAAASLFQRFNQADSTITRRFGGTGLGLAISRALIEMMDGRISAESHPGRGSVFRVELPMARRQTLAAYDAGDRSLGAEPMAPGGLPTFAGQPLRILLAEDHPTNQKVVQLILDPYDAEITIVENGAEAVEAFRSKSFDLVLMDMQMPLMDGLAATRAIRAEEHAQSGRGRTPVVMLSANAMAQHRMDALAAGADLHLAKPVTAASLLVGIGDAMDLKSAWSLASAG